MNRVTEASHLINNIKDIKSLLDVGCRDCILQKSLSDNITYIGCDLYQNQDNSVSIVGDITSIEIESLSYDCVVALDLLEHVDDPYFLFDKLYNISRKYLIINLPNGYDLKSRMMFINGHLSEKYEFKVTNSLDRHRWIMGHNEIINFYQFKAHELNSNLKIRKIKYGERKLKATSLIGLSLRLLPDTLSAESIMAVFEKN